MIRIPLKEFRFTYSRASGPGGQRVNKVSTKVTLRWDVISSPSLPADVRVRLMARFRRRFTAGGELLVVSQRFRDQGRNVADCLTKLAEMVRTVAEPEKLRKPTRPPAAAKRRRLASKKHRAMKKQLRRPPASD